MEHKLEERERGFYWVWHSSRCDWEVAELGPSSWLFWDGELLPVVDVELIVGPRVQSPPGRPPDDMPPRPFRDIAEQLIKANLINDPPEYIKGYKNALMWVIRQDLETTDLK